MRKSAAVVRNGECQFSVAARECDVDLTWAGVFDCIHNSFLRDVVKLRGSRAVADVNAVVAREAAGNAESLADVRGQSLKRDIQSVGFQFR